MKDWIDTAEYDRWKTDPDYRAPDSAEWEIDMMIDAANSWDSYYQDRIDEANTRRAQAQGAGCCPDCAQIDEDMIPLVDGKCPRCSADDITEASP